MKKLMYPLMMGLMAVVLTACGSNEEGKNNQDKTKTAQADQHDHVKIP